MSATTIHQAAQVVESLEAEIQDAPEQTEDEKLRKGLLEAQLEAARRNLQAEEEMNIWRNGSRRRNWMTFGSPATN